MMTGISAAQVDSSRALRGFIWLLALTLAVRVGVLLVMPGALAGDPDGYRRLAENVVEHGTLGEGTRPTAYRPPLYSLLLAPCVALGDGAATVAIGGLHLLLGLGTVWLVWRIGQRCGLGRRAWVAGALVACDPILLGQSTVVMTETLAAFLVALALLALVRVCATACRTGLSKTAAHHTACDLPFESRSLASSAELPVGSRSASPQAVAHWRCAVAGAALGLCGLCRPELLLWAAVCVPAIVFLWNAGVHKPNRDREGAVWKCQSTDSEANGSPATIRSLTVAVRLRMSIAMLLGMAVVLLPWAVRNQIQFGRPIVATTHGGYTLLLANNPSFYEFLRDGKPGTVWDARELGPVWGGKAHFDSPADELAVDRQAYDEAWQNIRRQPGMFAHSCLARAGRFWALAPHQGSAVVRWAIGAWYLVVFLLAVSGFLFHHGGTEDAETGKNSIPKVPPCPPCLRGESSGLWLFGLLLAISMTAVHAVYWSDMRMRAPLVPVVALAAAGGIARLWGRVRSTQGVDK